jgi:hypothetical protein
VGKAAEFRVSADKNTNGAEEPLENDAEVRSRKDKMIQEYN